jgi:alpha-L-rhamnosidase
MKQSKTNIRAIIGLTTLVFFSVTSFIGCQEEAMVRVTNLSCEYLTNPKGIDETEPQLSWQLVSEQRGQKQTAYRLLVASSKDKLENDEGDLWDSGKINSDQSINVAYYGVPLESRMHCYWKVCVWDKNGKTAKWSEPAEWSMGLLKPEDWTAKWITNPAPERLSYPWLRRTFDVKENIERAVIHVNTPSYYELHINGKKVSPYVLTPGISQIQKRFLINTYDVSSYLVKGTNCIALWMGPGWYQPRNGNKHNSPILRAQLDIQTPSGLTVVGTDSRWRVKESCISQIGGWKWADFGGEHYDGREFIQGWDLADLDDSKWLSARKIPAPINIGDWDQREREDPKSLSDRNIPVLSSWQACESAKLSAPSNPKKIYQLENGKWVLDFGRPLTGWMRLRMHNLKPGQEIHINYADVNDNGRERKLSHMPGPDGFQTFNQKDTYIGAGNDTETFCSKFNYHSFRYAVISGLSTEPQMDDAEAMMIEPDMEAAGSFECSNELFNQIYEITKYSHRILNPCLALGTGEAREKSAYGGDGSASLTGYLYNFQCAANFTKWNRDWSDSQREDGWFKHTAPSFEDHGGGPSWGGIVSELVRRMHLYYGDQGMVEQMYDKLRKYVDYVESNTQDGILRAYSPTGKNIDWRFIGDWVRPTKEPGSDFYFDTTEEREFYNNCYRVLLWQQLQDYAKILGMDDEYKRCSEHLAIIRPLIHKTFFLEDKGTYIFNNQGCLSIALYAQIPPAELRSKILAQLEHEIVVNKKGHLDTGMLGTFLMLDLLIKENRNDLIALIMGQTTYPGWGYLIKEVGVNTWTETWSGWGSQVIMVTATPGAWFFEGLGGITPDPEKPGFKHFNLRPGIVNSVDWVKCDYKSPYGKIVSNWKIENDLFEYDVTVPANSTATVYIQGNNITESGLPIEDAVGITFIKNEDGASVYEVESGNYSFESTLN